MAAAIGLALPIKVAGVETLCRRSGTLRINSTRFDAFKLGSVRGQGNYKACVFARTNASFNWTETGDVKNDRKLKKKKRPKIAKKTTGNYFGLEVKHQLKILTAGRYSMVCAEFTSACECS